MASSVAERKTQGSQQRMNDYRRNETPKTRVDAIQVENEKREMNLRIGIINLMPRGHEYEELLISPLRKANSNIDLKLIRLANHQYKTWDSVHLEKYYRNWSDLDLRKELDAVILTGAPVEQLEFEQVEYWEELTDLVTKLRKHHIKILGLCWGGLALAKTLGIEKRSLEKKLFGIDCLKKLDTDHLITRNESDIFYAPQSRNAEIQNETMIEAAMSGVVNLLGFSERGGYTLFESGDGEMLMHLGHPEYSRERIDFEIAREKGEGNEQSVINGLLIENLEWYKHRKNFFESWIESVESKMDVKEQQKKNYRKDSSLESGLSL